MILHFSLGSFGVTPKDAIRIFCLFLVSKIQNVPWSALRSEIEVASCLRWLEFRHDFQV